MGMVACLGLTREIIMKFLMAVLRRGTLVVAAAGEISCGGSGGGSAASTAPVISGLVIHPTAAYVSDTPLSLTTRFDFTDPDGNLASLTLRILDGSGATVDLQTLPVPGTDGLTEGTILADTVANAVNPDTYTAQIHVTDTTGLQSNTLTGSARIAAYPWTNQLADPIPRDHAASVVLNGKVYVMGGQRTDSGTVPGPVTSQMQVYDLANNTWSATTPMPTARMGLVAAVMDGRIYAIGGSADGFGTLALGTVEVFDPVTHLWSTLMNPMPTPRYFAAAAVLDTPLGTRIFVAGGKAGDATLNKVEAFDPVARNWIGRTAMPTARAQLATAEANGLLYAVGGYADLVLQWVGTVEEYAPLTDTWAARAPMPTARAHLTLSQVDGQLLAAGGENVDHALTDLENYDPSTNVWVSKTPSMTTFTRATAGVVNGRMLVFGNGLSLAYDPANEIR